MGWYLFWIAKGLYHYRHISDFHEYLSSSWNVGFWPMVGTIVGGRVE